MRKQRRGPALFELLQGDRSERAELLNPSGLRVVRSDHEDHDPAHHPEEALAISAGLTVDVGKAAGQMRSVATIVELDGSRLRLNLTPVTAAVAVFLVCLVGMAGFVIGERRGDKAGFVRGYGSARESLAAGAGDAVETARNQPPATQLVTSLLEDSPDRVVPKGRMGEASAVRLTPAGNLGGSAATVGAVPATGWVRDFTYIVAQEFTSGREEDARRARAFLGERGIAADIVRLDGGAIQLITLQGYNHKDPAQKKLADELLKKQRAAGAEYFASGGGYKLEGYYRTLKRDQW